MSIRRITAEYSEDVLAIMQSFGKIQNLPKGSLMASIHDPHRNSGVSLYDRIIAEAVPIDMAREDSYWFGNFSDDDELIAIIKFKFWLDPDTNQYCWTMRNQFRKVDTDYEFSYRYAIFPDEIIDLVNHGVSLAESRGMVTGYSILQNAVPPEHPNYVLRITDVVSSQDLLIGYDRYRHEVVEEIAGGKSSIHEKFRMYVNTMPISVKSKIIKMTKI